MFVLFNVTMCVIKLQYHRFVRDSACTFYVFPSKNKTLTSLFTYCRMTPTLILTSYLFVFVAATQKILILQPYRYRRQFFVKRIRVAIDEIFIKH